ncbi:MAG: phosphatidylserine/phosphatidylglycerophosphate/cardiolipin synthase family protein [Gammaproteobacteria bacterium]|nr:phosphatidylserine/phosphatidylglycerophosphate/cardiolipin synthase family protein [Gammaproteobacteria bacterium]MDH5619661.1 phosphatidylserine/phosphatidylglycerophosphate/cardiolipin synthase family protein [Gammaproteobacteria bacterium]
MVTLRITATLLALACFAGGCAATGDRSPLTRKAAGLGQAGWLYARSVYENPINRPVSHVASLGSLTVKSTGGALRRVSLNAFEMPALDGPVPAVSRKAPMDTAAFEALLDRTTGTRLDSGRIRFLVDGQEYFARLMEAIEQAHETIDIRTYIFDNDDFAVAMADELRERAKDVRVRVMIDSLGNVLATQADPESLPDGHDHPLSMKRYLERQSDVNVRQVTNPWLTSDHTKTTIIDRKIAFVGGMNIGREYRYDWHDMMMEVTGPVVDRLQFESEKAWSRSGPLGDFANVWRFVQGKQEHADRGGYPLRVLQTRNFNSQIHRAQIAAIQNARSHIYIQNPYFSDDRTLYELARARRRGVDVRVIIPARGNHGPLNASNKVTINTLLEHGIRVYEYPGMSHIKAAVYDGWMCVGSANFDKLSLKVNKELNLATSDPATVDALLSKVFVPDILISREITRPVPVSGATYWAEIMVDELM